MKLYAWLSPILFAAALSADPPAFVMATAAGYVPGASPIAIQQQLVQPVMVAFDPDGTLYYATATQVWELNPDGTNTLIAGIGHGDPSRLGDGGPAALASLTGVVGLAVDARQNVYIADLAAYEIRKVTPGGIITRFAGTGAPPLSGAQSNAGGSTLPLKVPLIPGPLAIDSTHLYVTDSGTASVLAFALDGKSSRVIAGNHGNDFAGDGGLALNASLFYPGTLALSNGLLSINEAGGGRIRQVTLRTGIISTRIQLRQDYLSDHGDEGLAADLDGTLYLQRGKTIARLAPGATVAVPYAGGGASAPGDPGPALDATLAAPKSLAINPVNRDLVLADTAANLVQVIFAGTGAIQAIAGSVHFAGDNGPAALAIFDGLESVVSDAQGNLYVADVGNNRIRKIDTTGIVSTMAGTGAAGYSGDNGPAIAATLNLKHTTRFGSTLAADSAGNLYISDPGNARIRKVDVNGTITTVAGGGETPVARGVPARSAALQPGPLAVDPRGNLYFGQVLGNPPAIPVVYKIDSSGQISPFAGISSSSPGPDSGPAVGTPIGSASCLAFDPAGNLYICDATYNRVRMVNSAGGMTSLPGDGNPPVSLAVDPSGNVFIASARKVSQTTGAGGVSAVAGTLAPLTSTGDGSSALQSTFTNIGGMAFDPYGNLYLTDGGSYLREALPAGPAGFPPVILSGGIVGAGGSVPPVQSVSPGAIVSIFGTNFASSSPPAVIPPPALFSDALPTNSGGICVAFGGIPAPILAVFPDQINVQVPRIPPGAATVRITANCGSTNPVPGNISGVAVLAGSPEFFSTPDPVTGRNYVATADAVTGGPIAPGSVVEAYGTGWGETAPSIPPGVVPGNAAPLAAAPALILDGAPIPQENILYVGLSPCCAGVYQMDFKIPAGTPSGDLPLTVEISRISSPADVYLPVTGQISVGFRQGPLRRNTAGVSRHSR